MVTSVAGCAAVVLLSLLHRNELRNQYGNEKPKFKEPELNNIKVGPVQMPVY